jgi:hypothetical protein
MKSQTLWLLIAQLVHKNASVNYTTLVISAGAAQINPKRAKLKLLF